MRSDEPEFRPNLFKATLRGHVRRLLGGVCNNKDAVKGAEDRLFGSSTSPGRVQIVWESQTESYNTKVSNPTYETEGILHINAPQSSLEFLELVLKFAFSMGGFGKSWRRVFHKKFYPQYPKLRQGLHIGCHWECPDSDWVNIKTIAHLQKFLDDLYQICCDRLGSNPPQPTNWREAWHPTRVAVYSQVVTQSKVVTLFHDDIFKETPAIGGKNKDDKRPTFVSSVWHRMLPIGSDRYLEIVTLFHGDRSPWQHTAKGDQLLQFTKQLKSSGLDFTWGQEPTSQASPPTRSPVRPRK